MRLKCFALGLALVLGGCSDDLVGPAPGEFDELCGEPAPLRLLPMDTDSVPWFVMGRAFADRYVFHMNFGDQLEDSEVWSVGQCGEDPIRLAEGVRTWQWGRSAPWPESWPDIPFACIGSGGQIFALDPSNAAPPHAVFESRECLFLPSARGVVTILGEGDTGPLVLQRWPNDPLTEVAEQVVLLDAVKAPGVWPSSGSDLWRRLRVTTNEVVAVTADAELVAISLDDLEVSVLAEGVREFDLGPSGRFVVWQGVELTNDDPDSPEGPIFLLDRESGESTQLGETALAYTFPSTLTLAPLGLLHYRRQPRGQQGGGAQWVRLDTLESYTVPGPLEPLFAIDDTRAVVFSGSWSPLSLQLLDTSTGELTPLFEGRVHAASYGVAPQTGTQLRILRKDGGELIDVGITGEVRTLARRATWPWRFMSGDRVVTPFAVGDDDIGSLVVVDPDTLDEQYIDHGVHSRSTSVFDDRVSYMVVDADPERHGIWLAKPAK